MQRTYLLALTMIGAALFIGCGTGRATLYVDNDSESAVYVEIEGDRELYIGSGNHAKRFVNYGDHRIVVRRKGEVIFDQVKTFEPHEDGPAWRDYLLDPEADTRYAVHEVYYYEDQKKANAGRRSRKLNTLRKKHWVDVPKGATALGASPLVFSTSKEDKIKRLSVISDE